MEKRKVQAVIFYSAPDKRKYFLLLKMNEKRKFYWQNITGGVEEDEGFEAAALREAQEETQLKEDNILKVIPLGIDFKFTDQWENKVLEKIFVIETKEKWEVIIDPSEHCDYKWVSESQIPRECVHFESNFKALELAKEIKC